MVASSWKTKVIHLLEHLLKEEEFAHLFLIDVTCDDRSPLIRVSLDGDHGLSFDDCRKVSRRLETHLDADPDMRPDYTLEVSSPGATRPLINVRQFPKHLGREFDITVREDKTKKRLKLTGIEEDVLIFETVQKKKKGKNKNTSIESFRIQFSDIEKALVKLSFNKK